MIYENLTAGKQYTGKRLKCPACKRITEKTARTCEITLISIELMYLLKESPI